MVLILLMTNHRLAAEVLEAVVDLATVRVGSETGKAVAFQTVEEAVVDSGADQVGSVVEEVGSEGGVEVEGEGDQDARRRASDGLLCGKCVY
jgi:hypothetical protein